MSSTDSEMRVCAAKTSDGAPRCGRTLPLDDKHFELINNGKNYRLQCKDCYNASRREKNAMNINLPRPRKPECLGCGTVHNNYRPDIMKYRALCHSCFRKDGHAEQLNAKNKRWRIKYPEKVKENNAKVVSKRKTDALYKLTTVKDNAKRRKISIVASDDNLMALMTQPCFGCGFVPTEEDELNGVDRIDSSKPYEDGNLSSACKWCNAAKGSIDLNVFLHKIHSIAVNHNLKPVINDRREYTRNFGHPHSANGSNKDKTVFLSRKECVELWCSPCHWCGFGPSAGIDRIDNDKPYTVENSQPCCHECNIMRKDLSSEDFIHIVSMVEFGDLERIPVDPGVLPVPQVRKQDRKLLKVVLSDDENDFVVFPSGLHCGKRGTSGFSISFQGALATASEYWTQEASKDKAMMALSKVWKFAKNHKM